jgi:serine/threonine protein kinase
MPSHTLPPHRRRCPNAEVKTERSHLEKGFLSLSKGTFLQMRPRPKFKTSHHPRPSPPWGEGENQPTAFADGRYQVKDLLGEGGKKKVYLAHDTTLDRDVAFALIKMEGLDDVGRARITREAQSMGRLGTHPQCGRGARYR